MREDAHATAFPTVLWSIRDHSTDSTSAASLRHCYAPVTDELAAA